MKIQMKELYTNNSEKEVLTYTYNETSVTLSNNFLNGTKLE